MQQCQFIKENQERCEANVLKDGRFCFSHEPSMREAKLAAVSRGGKTPKKNFNPLPPVEINDAKDVTRLLALTINEVREGKIDLRVANCIGFLSGHLIKSLETSEVETRIKTIERVILERKTTR